MNLPSPFNICAFSRLKDRRQRYTWSLSPMLSLALLAVLSNSVVNAALGCSQSGVATACCDNEGYGPFCYVCPGQCTSGVKGEACTTTGCGSAIDCRAGSSKYSSSSSTGVPQVYVDWKYTPTGTAVTADQMFNIPDATACAPWDCSITDNGWGATVEEGGLAVSYNGVVTYDYTSKPTSYAGFRNDGWRVICTFWKNTPSSNAQKEDSFFNMETYAYCTKYCLSYNTGTYNVGVYQYDKNTSTTNIMEYAGHHCNNFFYYSSSMPASITHCGDWKASYFYNPWGTTHSKFTMSGVGSNASPATLQINTDTLQTNIDLYMYCSPAGSGYSTSVEGDHCMSRRWRFDVTQYNCNPHWSYTTTDVSVCISATLVASTTVYASASSWFTYDGLAGGLCNPISSYELLRWSSLYTGDDAAIDSSTGALTVKTNTAHDSSIYRYQVTWMGQSESSGYVRIRSYCCTTSQSLTQPTLVTYQEYYIDNNRPRFYFDSFTQANSICPITGSTPYEHYTSDSSGTRVAAFRYNAAQWDSGTSKWYYELELFYRNTKAIYDFAFTPDVSGGHVHWAANPTNGSRVMQLNVTCGPLSARVDETALYYSTLYDKQYHDVSPGGTPSFLLPTWTSTSPISGGSTSGPCELHVFYTSSDIAADVPFAGLNHPTQHAVQTGYYEVTPTAPTVHARYDFYVRMQARGGATTRSAKFYTLIVGCLQAHVNFTISPTLTNTRYVGETLADQYTWSAPSVVPSYCQVVSYAVVSMTTSFTYTAGVYGVQTAASCAGVQPCNKLDLLSTSAIHQVKFKIRTTLTNGVYFDSSEITIDVICRTGSTTITSQLSTTWYNAQHTGVGWPELHAANIKLWYEQYNTVNNTFSWPTFTCQYPDCCRTLTYYVVSQGTDPRTDFPTGGTGPAVWWSTPQAYAVGHAQHGQHFSEIYTGHLQSAFNLWIYCKNEYNDYVYSMSVEARVVYDCNNDVIAINPATYNEKTQGYLLNTNTTYENNTWQQSRNILGNTSPWLPVLFMNETKGNVSYYSAPFKYRFVNNASAYCPLIQYKISKIMQKESRNYVPEGTFRNMFGIGSTNATFWVSHFDVPFFRWYIYLQAYNGKKWGGDDVQWQIDATLNSDRVYHPNMPPYFVVDPANYTLLLNMTRNTFDNALYVKDTRPVKFQLPVTFDAYPDIVTLSVANIAAYPYMTVKNDTRELVFDPTNMIESDQGVYNVTLVLTDDKGASRNYYTILTIISKEVEQVFLSSNKYADPITPGVRAKVTYTDRFGNLTLKFNSEMFTDFDWQSALTPDVLDVWIEPSGGRHEEEPFFNITKLNFTWTVQSFEVDELKLQLNFTNPIWISRETTHDNVVIDFRKTLNILKSKQKIPALFRSRARALQSLSEYEQRVASYQAVYEMDWVIKAKIPKQVPPTEEWRFFVWWVDIVRICLMVTLAAALLMALSFQTSLWYALAYLRYCQVTLHLPMLATPVSLNLLQFCATLLAFPRFDAFNWLWSRETNWGQFDFNEHYLLKSWIADQQEDLGYRTHNTLINLSTLAVLLFAYMIVWVFYWMVAMCKPCCNRFASKARSKKFKAFVDWLEKQVFYRWLFALFLFGFMEFVIAGFLGMYKPLDTYPAETLGNMFAYLSLCGPLIFVPTVYVWLHEDSATFDRGDGLKKKYPKAFTHFSVRHKRPSGWFFYPIYLAHRLTYCLLIMVFTSPTAQLLSMFTLNWLQLYYVGRYKPMKNRKQNYYEYFCELSISTVTLMVSYYRVAADDIERQWLYGDIIIVIILFHCAVSVLIVWYWLLKHAWLNLQLLYAHLEPYIDYFLWRLKRCWNWNKPVEDLNDLIPPDERKSGHSQAFLIIQRIKKEDLTGAEKKVRKFKIDTRDNDEGVQFDERDKEDVELNVGRLALGGGPGLRAVGDGGREHARKVKVSTIIEEDSLEEDEIKQLQQRVAETGLLNTLKAQKADESAEDEELAIDEGDFQSDSQPTGFGSTKDLQRNFEADQSESTARVETNQDLLTAIRDARKEFEDGRDDDSEKDAELDTEQKGQFDTELVSVPPRSKTKPNTRAGGRKRRNTNKFLEALKQDVAADEAKSEKSPSYMGSENNLKSIHGSIKTTGQPKKLQSALQQNEQSLSDYDAETDGAEESKQQTPNEDERARAQTQVANDVDKVESGFGDAAGNTENNLGQLIADATKKETVEDDYVDKFSDYDPSAYGSEDIADN